MEKLDKQISESLEEMERKNQEIDANDDDFATDLSVIGSGQYLQMYNVNPNEVLPDTFSDIFLISEYGNTFEELK